MKPKSETVTREKDFTFRVNPKPVGDAIAITNQMAMQRFEEEVVKYIQQERLKWVVETVKRLAPPEIVEAVENGDESFARYAKRMGMMIAPDPSNPLGALFIFQGKVAARFDVQLK